MAREIVFERKIELQELLSSAEDASKIKVVAGLRGAGKTYLLNELFYSALLRRGYRPADIFKADLSGPHEKVRDSASLRDLLEEASFRGTKFIFVDEIQMAGEGYADVLISFAKRNPGINLFVTGSNSKTLSDDIRKAFKEKAKAIFLRPLSFREIRSRLPDYDAKDYLEYGAIPMVLKRKEGERRDLLEELYCDTYLVDIKERFQGRYLSNIEKEKILVRMLSNLTSPLSESQIIKGVTRKSVLNREQVLLLKKEILDFIEAISSSFLVCDFQLSRGEKERPEADFMDHRIKKYCFDLGLLNVISEASEVYRSAAAIENAIYLELRSRGINPHGGLVLKPNGETGEIDFIFESKEMTFYVQAVHTLEEKNRERELGNLLLAPNSAQKLIVFANNRLQEEIPSSIQALSFEKFLLSDSLF